MSSTKENILANWAGVDYGSKLAGTTCLAWAEGNVLQVVQAQKNKDADEWLTEKVQSLSLNRIFIDAPLSLPPAYFNQKSDDFFYRLADRELKAMSPMFLGGLTARAMRLKKIWMSMGVEVFETYPAALAKEFGFIAYKENLNQCMQQITRQLEQKGFQLRIEPENWHQLDALLAWYSGLRWLRREARIVGDDSGRIVV